MHLLLCKPLQGASAATKRGAPICYDFVKGMCSRGAECRYSHDISSVIHGHQGRPATASEPCFDFLRCGCCIFRLCALPSRHIELLQARRRRGLCCTCSPPAPALLGPEQRGNTQKFADDLQWQVWPRQELPLLARPAAA